MQDVNVQFREEKLGQIAQARAIVEANRRDIANYDSGATQAAIDARMAGQVAQGKIEMVGADRYRVLEGWDRNEIFSVQRAVRPGEIPLILPETGLDTRADGKAALYLAEPAWHELGQVIPGGTTSITGVLKLSGGDYGVAKVQGYYLWKGRKRTADGEFYTVRKDDGSKLGAVGPIYTPVQNEDAMAFLAELNGKSELIWESAGPLRGGRKFFVSVRLPEDVIIDEGGTGEVIRPYVAVINSHDGTSPLIAITTPWNIVCGNTERFALRDAHTTWKVRHTTNALQKVEEARKTLGLTVKYYDHFKAEEEQLARTTVLLDEFDKLVADLWPLREDEIKTAKGLDKAKATAAERHEQLRAGFSAASGRLGRTGRAAEYTITEWLDHTAPRRALKGYDGRLDPMAAAKATIALEGGDDDLKSRAHKRLLTLASRP